MNNHCLENEQSNVEANDKFLTKVNAEEYNAEDVGDAEIKDGKHCWCLQMQQGKAGNVSAEEGHRSMKDEEAKTEGGDQMVEEAEAADSLENVKAQSPATRPP